MTRRIDAYRHALTDLTAIEHTIAAAQARLWDARSPLPGAASYDGPTVSGGSSTSPTERHAINGDPTQRDRDAFDKALRHLTTQAAVLRRLVDTWTPHAASSKDRAQVERANDPTPECAVTRELIDAHEPAHRTSDCGGILPAPLPLGRWVYDFVRSTGRRPTVTELTRHHRGQTVRVGA